MEMKGLVLLFLGVWVYSLAMLNISEAAKKPTPNLQTVWGKVQQLQKKLSILNKKLKESDKKVATLQQQMDKVDEAKGIFADDSPCPNSIPDFYKPPHLQSCYYLDQSFSLVNWTTAVAMCQQLSSDAYPVSIETEEEQDYLRAKWKNERGIATISRFWTGGRRIGNDWYWDGSREPMAFQNWIPTTNNEDERFLCAAVYSTEGYYWGNVACWAPHLVTCEIDL